MTDRILNLHDVMKLTSKPRTSVYLAVRQGSFPAPRKSGRRTVWLQSEIEAWMAGLPVAGWSAAGGKRAAKQSQLAQA